MVKKEDRTIIGIELFLLVLLLFMLSLVLFERSLSAPQKVFMAFPDVENAKWAGVKYGIRMAAKDLDMDVVFEDQEFTEDGMELRIPDLDCIDMGKALADQVLSRYEKGIGNRTIGVLYSPGENEELVEDCMEGFCEELSQNGATVSWKVMLALPSVEGEKIAMQERVDLIVAMDNDSLLAVANMADEGNLHGEILYGIGQCTDAIYYLDKGVVDCLIVPDVFLIGYQGFMLQHSPNYIKQKIGYTVLTRKQLFSKENQMLIYTLSQ